MFRLLTPICIVLTAGLLASSPSARPADDRDTCSKDSGDTTIAACTRAIESNTFGGRDLAAIYVNRCVAYNAKRDLDGAVADCSAAIRLDPTFARAFNSRGYVHATKDDHDRAIADYGEAIRLDPNYAIAFNNRGYAYAAKGDLDRAIADYSAAIGLDPDYAPAFNNRGDAYKAKGNLDRAIAHYDEAIRLDPNYAVAFNQRGNAYKAKGDLDHALADYGEAIRLDPKGSISRYNRGNLYRAKGDLVRAIADYDEAIRLDPKDGDIFKERGHAYKAQGDLERAIADYGRALRLDPQLADARMGLEQARALLASRRALAPNAVIAEQRVALVIGNSEYRSATFLPNPRRDAKAVADALREVGFQTVTLEMDLSRDAMVKALRSFRAAADRADWALIYFAGHGIEINRVNYLVPTDAQLEDERDVKAETVSYEEMLATVSGARALRMVVLDACRVNPFKDRMRRIGSVLRTPTDRGLAPPPDPEPGTLVVYSAKDGDVAADDADGINGPFARAFVAQLKVPGLEVRRLFDYVRDDVLDATNKRQQPFTYGSLPGRKDYFFLAAK